MGFNYLSPYDNTETRIGNSVEASQAAQKAIDAGAEPDVANQQAAKDAQAANQASYFIGYKPDTLTSTMGASGYGNPQGAGNVNPYGASTTSFTNPANYGWDNFTPGAEDSAGYYAQLAQWQQQQQAPTLQRTSIDWSGMGSGQQPAPSGSSTMGAPMPSAPASMPQGNTSQERSNYATIQSEGGPGPAIAPNTTGGARAGNDPNTWRPPTPIQSPGTFTPIEGSPGSTSQAQTAPPAPAPSGSSALGSIGSFQPRPAATTMRGGTFNPPGGVGGSIAVPTSMPGSGAEPPLYAPPNASTGGTGSPTAASANTQGTVFARPGVPPSTAPRLLSATDATNAGTAGAPPPTSASQASATSPAGVQQRPITQGGSPTMGMIRPDQPTNAYADNARAPGAPTFARNPATGASTIGGGGIPAVGQFSNPVFQQQQQTRNVEGAVMNKLGSPDMYKSGQEGTEAAARNTQEQTMAKTGAADLYKNPDQATQAQGRSQQQSLIGRLQSDMDGGAPSAAQAQLRSATDQNIATQAALAASGGPTNYAMAQRTAATNTANANQQAANESAALKAREYAQARSEMGTATTAGRSQDLSNLGMDYSNTTNQAQLQAQQAQAARAADLQRLGMDYSNTTAQTQIQAQQSQAMRAADLQATGMSYDNAMKQAQFELDQNKTQAQLEAGQKQLNTSAMQSDLGMGQATLSNDLASRMHYMDLASQRYANDRGLAQQAGQFQTQQNNLMAGTAMSGIGAIAGAALMASDERLKTNIAPASSKDTSEFLGKLQPSVFRYKDEKFGRGKHVGFMAQDAEKSRLGKSIVRNTPHGKMLEVPKLLSASVAALAHMEQRVRKLEKKPTEPAGKQTFGARKAA